jgi:acyl-CoA reductase-like NAD-dependent aldehyde dehydrogenase
LPPSSSLLLPYIDIYAMSKSYKLPKSSKISPIVKGKTSAKSKSSSKTPSPPMGSPPTSARIAAPELEPVEPTSDSELPTTKVAVRRSSSTSSKSTNGSAAATAAGAAKAAAPQKNPVEAKPTPKPEPVQSKANDNDSDGSNLDTAESYVDVKKETEALVESKSLASTVDTSVLQYTPLSEIPGGVKRVVDGFHSGKTHPLEFRLKQLRNLYFAVKDNQEAICDALSKDFHRVSSETRNYEIVTGLNELLYTMSQLHKWSKPLPVDELPLNLMINPTYVERIPVGTVLVIAAFNYPLFVSISPIAGAIAAGNTVVFKPSELTPHFSKLFTDLMAKALDPDVFYAVNGSVPETTELLNQKFDKIIYTGSETVGKIIAKKAAETLTPAILELGGKSPAFVLDDVADKDLPIVARRIAWGRYANAGQTCIGVDYVLVAKSKHDKFIKALRDVIEKEFFPNVDVNSNFTHLIHDRAFNKMKNILDKTTGKIIIGGKMDSASRYVSPTVIDDATWDDSSMQEEIFGPILPILTYTDLTQACRDVVSHHDTPLAEYIFTSGSTSRKYNSQINTIATIIRSGGLVINDVLMHIALHNAPFGGIGKSGHGAYHGEFSYRAFTHERTVLEQNLWNDWIIKSRYPPYSNKKDRLVASSQGKYGGRVWFGRQGDVKVDGPSTFFSAWTNVLGVAGIVRDFIGASL